MAVDPALFFSGLSSNIMPKEKYSPRAAACGDSGQKSANERGIKNLTLMTLVILILGNNDQWEAKL